MYAREWLTLLRHSPQLWLVVLIWERWILANQITATGWSHRQSIFTQLTSILLYCLIIMIMLVNITKKLLIKQKNRTKQKKVSDTGHTDPDPITLSWPATTKTIIQNYLILMVYTFWQILKVRKKESKKERKIFLFCYHGQTNGILAAVSSTGWMC